MATKVDEELEGKISATVEAMRGARMDTTGNGIVVPPEFDICVFDSQTKAYRKAGHYVQATSLTVMMVGGEHHAVAFVKFGDPSKVAANVRVKQLFVKPVADKGPSLWETILGHVTLPDLRESAVPKPGKPQEA